MIVYKKRVKVSKNDILWLCQVWIEKKRKKTRQEMSKKKILIRSVTEQQKSCCNSTNIGMRLILGYGTGLLQGPRYVRAHISKINGFSLVHVYYMIHVRIEQ